MKYVRPLSAGLVVVAATALAGCGDPEPQAKESTSTPSSTTSSTTPAPTTSTTTSVTTTKPTTTKPTTSKRSPKPSTTSRAPKPTAKQVRSGMPTRLSMPSLGFDQPIRALGLTNGAINPPPHVVQWYTGSPRPGSQGISVIAGHVGSYGGRAGIFSRLPQLSAGDRITIGYAGGGQRTFKIYAKEAVGKKALQNDSRVWGGSSKPIIALITCDSNAPSQNGHSVRNYVVWAAPV